MNTAAPASEDSLLPAGRLRVLVSVGLAGLVLMLAGLVWDAAAHARDATLAHRESVLSLSSPSHALLFLGAGLALAGLVGAGWEATRGAASRVAFGVVTALALSATGAGLVWASGLEDGHPEPHGTGQMAAGDIGADPDASAPAAAAAHQHGPGIANSHGSGECAPTSEQVAAAEKLVVDTTAGVGRFATLEAALADGYATSNNPPLPTEHYYNPAYANDGVVLDPNRPEILVYTTTDRGVVLSGAMYLTNVPGEFGPEVGGCLTQWHVHANLCFAVSGAPVTEVSPDGTCAPGSVRYVPPPALHVWLVDVPGGRFAAHVDHAVLVERLGT